MKIMSTLGLIVFFWNRTIPPPFFAGAEDLAAATALGDFFFAARAVAALPSSMTLVGK